MAADILTSLATWSTAEGSNLPSGTTAISTNLDDNLRMIQSVVRYTMASDTIASATTTDLGTKESQYLTVSGVTTITGLGTISAGITKYVTFSGALILTHNATSLIIPGAANITTAAGDTARFLSLGSGNWKCLTFTKASGRAVVSTPQMEDGTVSLPGMPFTSDLDTGVYRIGANNWGLVAGGTKIVDIATTGATVTGLFTNTGTASLASGALVAQVTAGVRVDVPQNGTGGFVVQSADAANTSSNVGYPISLYAGDTTLGQAGSITLQSGSCTTADLNGNIDLRMGSSSNYAGDLNIYLENGALDGSNVNFKSESVDFYQIDGLTKHINVVDSGNTPTITAGGGTGPTITGTDHAFQITIGTGASSSIEITPHIYNLSGTRVVIAQHQGAVLPLRCSVNGFDVITITASSNFTAGGVIDVISIWIV